MSGTDAVGQLVAQVERGRELLERIEGVRDPVIGEETAQYLGELLRFRHFRRYYFELEYDWDKLDYLQKVFTKVAERLPGDLAAFQSFLGRLRQLEGGSA